MGVVKLFATEGSVFCARIQWALKLKGVEYEFILEDLANKSPLLLKYNPIYKKVPVLVHGDIVIVESLVILEYIEDTWKEHPLLPRDPYDRATARFWAKFNDEKLLLSVWAACTGEGEAQEKAKESALESLALVEKQIEGKKFFGGEQIGYLDLVLGWIPHWISAMEEAGGNKVPEAEMFPSLHQWGQNFIHTPLIEECIPAKEALVPYLRFMIEFADFKMGDVKVIGASLSLFCCRIEWALKHKGIAYEYIEEDLRNKSHLLLRYNPVHKKVPVLVHGEKPVAESLVILEYIDETWRENPLLPEDPFEKATARFWAKYVDEKCVISAWTASRTKGHEQEKSLEAARESLEVLNKLIEGKKFFGGEIIGFLDLVVGTLPNWLKFLEESEGIKLFDTKELPFLHEWAQRFTEIPIIKGSMPTAEDLINYNRDRQKAE
ncbi:hypothetical protein ACFX2I_015827 [Malus domestica]